MRKIVLNAVVASLFISGCATGSKIATTAPNSNQTDQLLERTVPPLPQKRTPVHKGNTATLVKNKQKTKIDYASRRVVQIGMDKTARSSSAHVDIQEGATKGVFNVVSMYGENHTVEISRKYPSLILTPFADPEVKGNLNSQALKDVVQVTGSNIMVWPKTAQNLWLMIYDNANPRGIPVTLTLMPKQHLMSRTITVAVGRQSPAEEANGLNPGNGSFAQKLSNALQDIVMLKIPSGYTVRPLKEKLILENGMATLPIERYSGEFDIYRYRISNRTGMAQELEESMFGQNKRVRAVAFYPKTVLYPGESTDVLMLISKRN